MTCLLLGLVAVSICGWVFAVTRMILVRSILAWLLLRLILIWFELIREFDLRRIWILL